MRSCDLCDVKTEKATSSQAESEGWSPLGNLDGVLSSDEQVVLAEALRTRPPKAVRVRLPQAHGPASDGFLPFSAEPVPWYPDGFFCSETHQPGRFLEYAAGAYFIQDAGSMLALRLLDVQPHEWVADVCAAQVARLQQFLNR